jgi:hypothetical protein
MSETQKKAIYDTILKNFTIGSTAVSASCVYENQIIPDGRDSEPLDTNATYPLITLKYHDTEETILDMGSVVMKTARLNVNIFAYNIDGRPSGEYLNGKRVVDAMTKDILEYLEANHTSLFSDGVFINDRIEGVTVRDLSTIATRKHVYRNKFTLNITYEV